MQNPWFKEYCAPLAIVAGAVLALLAIAGVNRFLTVHPADGLRGYVEPTRHALAVADDPFGDAAAEFQYLEQGWTPRQSMDFYTRTQGSRLIPYAWFLAVEQAGNENPLRDPANMN